MNPVLPRSPESIFFCKSFRNWSEEGSNGFDHYRQVFKTPPLENPVSFVEKYLTHLIHSLSDSCYNFNEENEKGSNLHANRGAF